MEVGAGGGRNKQKKETEANTLSLTNELMLL